MVDYFHGMDRGYTPGSSGSSYNFQDPGYFTNVDEELAAPIDDIAPLKADRPSSGWKLKEIGMSTTESPNMGRLTQTSQSIIKAGAGSVELGLSQGGGIPAHGAESYGAEEREDLRALRKANEVNFTVHAPVNIGNLSGFDQQNGGFFEEQRHNDVNEIKSAIKFAADVAGGGPVVVHTGEFQRPMYNAWWNQENFKGRHNNWANAFEQYPDEEFASRQLIVNDRTGRFIGQAMRSEFVFEPEFLTAKDIMDGRYVGKRDAKTGRVIGETDYVDMQGNYLDEDDPDQAFHRIPKWDKENQNFKSVRRDYDYFVEKAREYNERHNLTDPLLMKAPEEMFQESQIKTQILQARGGALFHSQHYDMYYKNYQKLSEAYEYYKNLESKTPKDQLWRLKQQAGERYPFVSPDDPKLPSEILKDHLDDTMKSLRVVMEQSSTSDNQAERLREDLKHIMSAEKYAKIRSITSYAQLGLSALEEEETNPHMLEDRDLFVAPENIFPQMGYGSHPEELIELVQKAREKMADYLVADRIVDPNGRRDPKTGKFMMVDNPHKRDITRDEAMEIAKSKIKATFDTGHLGMWYKHFKPLSGETEKQRLKRFNGWYEEMVKRMHEADILGHIHIVDQVGATHNHLPPGEGGNFPVVDAASYLKKMGYEGSIVSEGFGQGTYRHVALTWSALGVETGYGYFQAGPGADLRTPQQWNQIQYGYFGATRPPNFIFGQYVPSNDFTSWTQVQLE